MKKTFYFNSGVKPWNSSYLAEGDIFINNEKHHPFICEDVPENSSLQYLCNNGNLGHGKLKAFKVIGGNMHSDYAYFIIPD